MGLRSQQSAMPQTNADNSVHSVTGNAALIAKLNIARRLAFE
jgi:hypothetical protein